MPFFQQQAFSAGELSPRMKGLRSLDQYQVGCQTLENAILTRFGSCFKRWGTRYVGTTDGNVTARLLPFNAGVYGWWVIEIVPTSVRAWDPSLAAPTTVVVVGASALTVPYTSAELADLSYFQDIDTLYVLHKDHAPRRVSISSDGVLSWGNISTKNTGPFLKNRSKAISLTHTPANGNAFDASAAFFVAGDVGSYFRLSASSAGGGIDASTNKGYIKVTGWNHETQAIALATDWGPTAAVATNNWDGPYMPDAVFQDSNGTFASPGAGGPWNAGDTVTLTETGGTLPDLTSTEIGMIFDFNTSAGANTNVLVVTGAGVGTVTGRVIQGTVTASTTYTGQQLYVIASRLNDGVQLTPSALSGTGVTISASADVFATGITGDANEAASFIHMHGGRFEVKSLVSGAKVTGDLEENFRSLLPTTDWSQTWSPQSGFPRCGTIHQDRLFFGGVAQHPSKIFVSKTGEHLNFTLGALDDDGMSIELSDEIAGAVSWMRSAGDLLVGTDRAEFALEGRPITPTQLGADLQSAYSGASVTPRQVAASVMFVSAEGTGIREMVFRFETDRYQAPDLTDLSDHLFSTAAPIRDIEYLTSPETILFARRSDGALRALTYRRENQVVGWSPWPGINAESIAVVRKDDVDQLWVLAKRVINSVTQHYIEILEPADRLDSHIITAPASTTITGLSHLEAETVDVLADGKWAGSFTVASGQVTLPSNWTTPASATVGLPITFKLKGQHYEVDDRFEGASSGKKKRVTWLKVLVNQSYGGDVIDDSDTYPVIPMAASDDPPVLVDGWQDIPGVGVIGFSPTPLIQHTSPHPFEVLSLQTEVVNHED
ncbi:MAG: hypothetical protein ACE5HA_03285 [Anaerolineae bacterium]